MFCSVPVDICGADYTMKVDRPFLRAKTCGFLDNEAAHGQKTNSCVCVGHMLITVCFPSFPPLSLFPPFLTKIYLIKLL